MPESKDFKIRRMVRDDLGQAIELSNSEGWNQTEKDWRFLLENPENTCIVAEYNNKVAATATALNHSGKVAWIGMVLVEKSLRGHGAGKMLLRQIIEHLENIPSVKLDATPAGQPLYHSLGFLEEYKIIRMTIGSLKNYTGNKSMNNLYSIDRNSFPGIRDYDKTVFGADRPNLLKYLLVNYPDKAFFFSAENKLSGYIFGRDGTKFNYIGPVSAVSSDIARSLLSKALESIGDKPAALDVLEDKTELIEWLESIGFVKQRHFVRMYLIRNPDPGLIPDQYLISGPEFG
jgi:ribosomal protein S18 acetylase RimI-like enzyme